MLAKRTAKRTPRGCARARTKSVTACVCVSTLLCAQMAARRGRITRQEVVAGCGYLLWAEVRPMVTAIAVTATKSCIAVWS